MKGCFTVLALMLLLCLSAVPLAPDAEAAATDWIVEGQMPQEKTGFVSVELSDGRIFAALGYNSSSSSNVDDAWIFDPYEMTWNIVADAPVRTRSSTGACINDVVYIFGGIHENFTHLDNVLIYDASADEWSIGPTVPFENSFLRAGVMDDRHILVVGAGPTISDCYIFDTEELTFSPADDIPGGRSAGTLVREGNGFLYFGGWDSSATVQDEVYRYDIIGDNWYFVDRMPEARTGMIGVMGSDGLVYLLGGGPYAGWSTNNVVDCQAYDVYGGTFIELPDLPEPFRYAASHQLDDGRIICFGGHELSEGSRNVYSIQAWEVEISLSSDTVEQGGSVWLSVNVRTNFAPMEELYGYVFLTAMGVTYATYDIFSMGSMAYLEIPISENIMPLGYVLEFSGIGYNYKQNFEVEALPLTVTEAPSTDDRLDTMQDELNDTRDELKEALDAKLDAMIGYVILILVIVTLVVAVIVLVRKK